MATTGQKIRGVNLGGWLVLEKWMTPSLFDGLQAEDETDYCVELGARAEQTLKQHWNRFITEADFAWLAAKGINAVRIPVGHWIFGGDYPYHRCYGEERYPYVVGGIDVLDRAFDWAETQGLSVLLDLHTAPGCQNGFDNGGISGVCEWHTQQTYIDHTLDVLERLAERYHSRLALLGIEVLNEPHWEIATDVLQTFTAAAYQRIRRHCHADRVAVVFHDGFRSHREYVGLLQAPEHQNVVFDIHRYQCFIAEDINTDIHGHIIKAAQNWKQEADAIIRESRWRTWVGEWSLGLDSTLCRLWAESPQDCPMRSMDAFQQTVANRAYAAAQLLSFEKYQGWFFWSYKTETMPQWSFRECVERGWLPDFFG